MRMLGGDDRTLGRLVLVRRLIRQGSALLKHRDVETRVRPTAQGRFNSSNWNCW